MTRPESRLQRVAQRSQVIARRARKQPDVVVAPDLVGAAGQVVGVIEHVDLADAVGGGRDAEPALQPVRLSVSDLRPSTSTCFLNSFFIFALAANASTKACARVHRILLNRDTLLPPTQ